MIGLFAQQLIYDALQQYTMSKDFSETIKTVRGTELDSNLKKVAKGTGIIFFGEVIGTIFGLISMILVARFYSTGEYGLYSLGLFIISFFLRVSSLGVFEGCPRYISYYRGKADEGKVKGIITSSLTITGISSTIIAILLFFLSDFIANRIFGIEELSTIIKIIVIGLPFWAIIRLIVSIFRGFESVKENVYFSNLSLRLLKVPFFALVIFLGLSFNYIIVVYTLSIIITCFAAIFYLVKKLPEPVKKIKKASSETKILLSFSLPLVFSGLGWYLISGADKIMLGILKTQVEVGLYSAAATLAQYLLFFYSATIFIYQPIASRVFAENKMDELKRNYQILTKWLFILAFPFVIVFLLFPGTVISIIFGEKYISAAIALQILTIPYFVHLFLGPNGATLICLGKTRMIMYFTLIGGGINVALNYFLIPLFGIEGAALSTMISYIIINGFNGGYLFKISKIHPFRKNYIFPIIISFIFIFLFYYLNPGDLSLMSKILSCLIIIMFYFVIIILSKSVDEEDLQLLLLFEKRAGIRFKLLRKIIKKFL